MFLPIEIPFLFIYFFSQWLAILRLRTNDACVASDAGHARTVPQGRTSPDCGQWSVRGRGPGWSQPGPPPGDVEGVELVLQPTVRGELGGLRRLEPLEGGRPAGRRVAALLLGCEEGPAQAVVVLRFYLQATDHVLLRRGRRRFPVHCRPAMRPQQQQRGQEHGASRASGPG